MFTLIRKDLRLYRPVVLTAFCFGFLFYVATPLIFQATENQHMPGNSINLFLVSVECGLLTTAGLSAVIGGMAFAMERRDSTADFIATLPFSRGELIYSKLIAAVVLIVIFFAVNFIILAAGAYMMQTFVTGREGMLTELLHQLNYARWPRAILHTPNQRAITAFAAGCFGASWFLSTLVKSPTAAAAIPLGFFAWVWFWLDVQLGAFNQGTNGNRLYPGLTAWRVELAIFCFGIFMVGAGIVIQRFRSSP